MRVYETGEFELTDHTGIFCGGYGAEFMPDGSLMMGADGDKIVAWDFRNFQFFIELQTPGWSRSITLSNAGDRIAVLAKENRIRVWDLKPRNPVEREPISFPGKTVLAVMKAPDDPMDRLFVLTHAKETVSATTCDWNGEDRKTIPIGGIENQLDFPVLPPVEIGIAFEGKNTICFGDFSGNVAVVDLETGTSRLFAVSEKNARIARVNFLDSGYKVAVQTSLDELFHVDLASGKISKPTSGIRASISLDDQNLLVLSRRWGDREIAIVDRATNLVTKLLGHASEARDFSFIDNGKTLVSAGADCTIRLWDIETGRQRFMIDKRPHVLTQLDVSANGKVIAAGSRLGVVFIYRHDLD